LGFRIQISDLGFLVSVIGSQVSDSGFLVSDFGFLVSDFGFLVLGFWFRISDLRLVPRMSLAGHSSKSLISGLEFRISGSGFWVHVPGGLFPVSKVRF